VHDHAGRERRLVRELAGPAVPERVVEGGGLVDREVERRVVAERADEVEPLTDDVRETLVGHQRDVLRSDRVLVARREIGGRAGVRRGEHELPARSEHPLHLVEEHLRHVDVLDRLAGEEEVDGLILQGEDVAATLPELEPVTRHAIALDGAGDLQGDLGDVDPDPVTARPEAGEHGGEAPRPDSVIDDDRGVEIADVECREQLHPPHVRGRREPAQLTVDLALRGVRPPKRLVVRARDRVAGGRVAGQRVRGAHARADTTRTTSVRMVESSYRSGPWLTTSRP
jgi:hypothetical protein